MEYYSALKRKEILDIENKLVVTSGEKEGGGAK